MSGEFDIYNNLNLIRGCNLLSQVKDSVAANCSKDSKSDDSLDDIDSLLNISADKIRTEDSQNQKPTKNAKKQVPKTNSKTICNSSEKDRPTALPLKVLGNANEILPEIPASKRKEKSLGRSKTTVQTLDEEEESLQRAPSKKGGRGARGRGRGRGRSAKTNASIISDDSPNEINDADYTPPTQQSEEPAVENTFSQLNQSASGHLAVMRNRRRCIAEMAARLPTLDTIDLVSSPLPRVEGIITLDSDGEEERPQISDKSTKSEEFNIKTLDDDNPELSIKIIWNGKPEGIKLRKYQKFASIFKLFAEREGVDIGKVAFNLNKRIISPDDTPESIGYKIFHFIDGRVMTTNVSSPVEPEGAPKKQRNPSQLSLKIQSENWKKPLKIDIMKTDKFRILYIKCAEELNVAIQQIKLSWDGEHLDPNETPVNLELEGGEAIDLHIKN